MSKFEIFAVGFVVAALFSFIVFLTVVLGGA